LLSKIDESHTNFVGNQEQRWYLELSNNVNGHSRALVVLTVGPED
jgi:hypothetical protein